MGPSGDTCWTRAFDGRNPSRVIVTGSQIAVSYIDDQRLPGAPGRYRLVSLDPKGNERWSIRDFRLELALHDERFVGVSDAGAVCVVDADGHKCDGIRDGKKKAAREGS